MLRALRGIRGTLHLSAASQDVSRAGETEAPHRDGKTQEGQTGDGHPWSVGG